MRSTTTAITAEPAARPLRADARRNHERILESARAVFAADGADAQMDDIARIAGVGVGTLYRHFPAKEALLVELMRDKLRRFADNARAALLQDGEPSEILIELLRRNAEEASGDTVAQQMLAGMRDHVWEQLQPEHALLSALTEQLIERARPSGRLRADLTAADVAMLMCGVSATMAHRAPGFDWHRHLELILDGLAAPAAPAS